MNNDTAATLALRPDLIRQRINMGNRFVWVLKDPLSRAFYYFSDREFSILRLLDGRRQLTDVITECKKRCAPDFVPVDSLVGFLADAKKNGLITSSSAAALDTAGVNVPEAPGSRFAKNPLAIRLPGINPDRVLDVVGPRLAFLFSPITIGAAAIIFVVATLLTVANLDLFTAHVSAATSRSSMIWLVTLALVIAATKVIHELAHAVACKSFGAECRELGVMFLVGIPCLYCDVSDAWMLPQRWKRIMVSAAGILAELSLAAIAACLWLLSNDGVVRDICVTTMIVCSVSTVLFNGNPLLRYDGYFILSDLLGMPNLSAESSKLVRGTFRRWLWSLPSVKLQTDASEQPRVKTLAVYGVLSGVYRFAVLLVIGMILYRLASSAGIGFVGGLLIVLLIGASLWRSIKSIVRPLTSAESRSTRSSRRPAILLSVCGLGVLLALLVPIPHSITAPMMFQATGEVEVFVESPGQLVVSTGAGSVVRTGDQIALLRNDQMEQALLKLQASVDVLQTELDSLHQRRSFDARAARQIPAVTKSLESAKRQLVLRLRERDRLVVRAPRSGLVLPPRNRLPTIGIEQRVLKTWDGTPLEAKNQGALMDQGTMFCVIGDPRRREALVLVRQQDIALMRRGQQVDVLTPTHSAGHFQGIVIEVASSPIEQVSREFFAAGLVDPAVQSNIAGQTRNTYYQVRVALTEADGPPLVRSTARARISVDSASFASRVIRFVSDSFRF